MKKILFAASFAVLLTACNDTVEKLADFSKPKLRHTDPSPDTRLSVDATDGRHSKASTIPERTAAAGNRAEFPTLRTLTDVNGRSIDARILAKKGNRIVIARLPSNQQFVLSLDKLAEEDRSSLSRIRDGGEFGAFESSMKPAALPANRRATWHSHIGNAEKEAAKLGIPLLVAVLVNRSPSATGLEKNLAYSREFKSWADRNVALCLIRTDGFEGTESRESTYDTWRSLQKYGIGQSAKSTLVLIDASDCTSKEIRTRGAVNVGTTISNIEAAIHEQSNWSNIVAAKAPVRAESPFKVASRTTESNGGST